MAKVIGIGSASRANQTIYDPTCGSGSLLLKAHDEARDQTGLDITIYGQEMDNATAALAKMNMILHDCPTAEIWKDNVLASPHFKQPDGSLKTFDFAVANPPFSFKAWSNGFNPAEDEFERFEYGAPPSKNGDYAFLLHILKSLNSTGKAAVNLPHGVLFRGNAEAIIRKEIVRRGYVRGIIGLPANLFYGTGIPACIIVLEKENAAARKGIFMIDASKGFIKDGNKNRLRAQDIHRIVDTFTRQLEIPRYSRMVPVAEISDPKNDFNLNLPRYIDVSEPEDLQDIDAHLRGGIPNRDIDDLEHYWQVLPAVRSTLFGPADRAGYSRLKVSPTEIKAVIFGHPEFTAFNQSVITLFDKWAASNTPYLKGITVGGHPRTLIEKLSEALLETFRHAPLLDPYDVYQHLMDYWAETMQDDVYMLVQQGWRAVLDGLPNHDLIPQALIARQFFVAEQAAIEKLEADRDATTIQLEELNDEHSGEDGLLVEAKTEKGKLTKVSVKARLADIKGDADVADEEKLLRECLVLIEAESDASRQVKDATKALEAKVAAHYAKLTEDEVKALVIDNKWLATLAAAVHRELDRVSHALSDRILELAKRYETPMPKIIRRVLDLEDAFYRHLERMGFSRK